MRVDAEVVVSFAGIGRKPHLEWVSRAELDTVLQVFASINPEIEENDDGDEEDKYRHFSFFAEVR
jgi:hypothetical protein